MYISSQMSILGSHSVMYNKICLVQQLKDSGRERERERESQSSMYQRWKEWTRKLMMQFCLTMYHWVFKFTALSYLS